MKRIILIAAILVGALFYVTATDYTENGYFASDGYVLSSKDVQENLYSDSNGETVKAVSVSAYDPIYLRGRTQYVGAETKTKINLTFPMYLNEGTAVQFLSGGVTLYDAEFNKTDAYEGMILNNGSAFSEDYIRSDWQTYYFAKLSNGLYINPFVISVTTYFNKYTIPANSIIYFTPNFVRYYYFENGVFKSGAIEDVDDASVFRMNGGYITYEDLLLGLGETVKAVDPVIPDQPEEPEPEDEPEEELIKKSVITPEDNPFADPEDPVADPSQIPQKEEEKERIANYQIPVVTPSNTYKTGVYTLTTQVKVKDPAGVISGGLTYEVIINEGDDKGKVYRRVAVSTDKDAIAVLISGLKPNYKYKLKAYYTYKNEYGKVLKPNIVFIDGYEFKTNEVGELGSINLQTFMLSMATIGSDYVEIPNLCFSYEESDMDAVSALSKIVIRLNDEDPATAKGFILNSKEFTSLKDFQAITYQTPKELKANTVYKVEVRCFDRYGNVLDVKNNTFTTRTCKRLPTAKLTIELPELKLAQFLTVVSNPDQIQYDNLTLKILDTDQRLVKEFKNINQNEIIDWETTGDGSTYIANVTVDCDINDNQGKITHIIYSNQFSTNSIDRLGSLYLEVANISKTECPNDQDIRAVLSMRLNKRFTNAELPNYVNYFNITFMSSAGDTFSYALTDTQLAELKTGNTIKIDSNDFTLNGLKSSETYSIAYTAAYVIDKDNSKVIQTSTNLSQIITKKANIRISMTDVQAYTGFIMAKIKISDLDNVITGDSVLLKIYKYEAGQATELVGLFRIAKNASDAYFLKMFNDASYSSDGCAYNIEGETDYVFRFIAEEAVTDDAAYTNYQLRKDEDSIVSTANGITGKISLYSLDEIASDTTHYKANYQVTINNPNTVVDTNKVYIDIKRKLLNTTETIQSGIEMPIEMNTTTYSLFDFITEKDKSTADYYYGELYLIIDGVRVPLSTMQFTTEEPIYTIKTFADIRAIGTKDRKYVVVNNIDLDKGAGGTDYWAATSNQLNSIIDFQGFELNFKGSWMVWHKIGQKGAIYNMVYNRYVYLDRRTSRWGSYDAFGGLCYYNYGIIENLNMTYEEEDHKFEYNDYYTDVYSPNPVEDEITRYVYPYHHTALVNQNYGIIRNFVIEIVNHFTTWYAGGVVDRDNRGKICNGYIFGSDRENEYKAVYKIMGTGSGTSHGGFMLCGNLDGGSITNVYTLVTCDTKRSDSYRGMLVSYNNSVMRNCYTAGHMLVNGTAYLRNQGPAVGVTSDSYITENVYYISDYTYKIDKYNIQVSSAALRNETWQESILNNGDGNFNVHEMMNVGCYPQVIYSSKYMPIQKFFELPEGSSEDNVDLVFSYPYVMGTDEELDLICGPYITGNEKWTTPNDNGDISDSQVSVLLITDKAHQIVHSIKMKDNAIEVKILKQVMDGTDVTKLYVAVKNPKQALSKYQVDSITFKDAYGDKGDEYMFNRSARYLNVDFYHQVWGLTGDDSWQHIRKYPAQNHKLMTDIDFSSAKFATEVFVNVSAYTGNLDGNNHTIGNITYDSLQFYTDGYKNESETLSTGIFKQINGKVFDLTIKNVNIEGGCNAGILAGTTAKATFTNVFIVNGYVAGLREVGALAGSTSLTTFENCGVVNVKVLSTGISTDERVALGGLIGRAGSYTIMLRCFAQNIYLETWTEGDISSSVGGLIGLINGNQTTLSGCYATGVIEALADTCGGLIGRIQAVCKISDCYTNVDVTVYKANAGGMVGKSSYAIEESVGIVFGNVTFGTRYATGADQLNYVNAVCTDTDRIGGYVYEAVMVNVNGENLPKTNAKTGSKKVTATEMTNGHFFDYINAIYYDTSTDFASGILPKIVDSDGNVLPYQNTNYLVTGYKTTYDSVLENSITYNVSTSADENMIQIIINHPSTIRIEKVYVDYSYVDESLGLIESGVMGDALGFDSLTSHKTLSFASNSYRRTAEDTTVVFSGMSVEAYYDIYKVTAIKYTEVDTGVARYLNIGEVLAIGQKSKDVGSISDWVNYVKGSLNENFNITGNIDFTGQLLRFDDEGCANRIIHRLNGTKCAYQTSADTAFLDYTNGKTDTFYKISNATIEHNTTYNRPYGWLNATRCGFIKCITAEITNITFENISVQHNASGTAIISSVIGTVKNVDFVKCKVNNTANRYLTGMIAYSSAYISNCLSYKVDVDSKGCYTSGFLALIDHYKYTTINNVYVVDSDIYNTNAYTGGFLALSGGGTTNYTALTSKTSPTLTDIHVSGTTVYSGDSYAGAVAGYMDYSHLKNVTVDNCKVSAKYDKVGGVVGHHYWDLHYCEVHNTTVSGRNYIGGICGFSSLEDNWIVSDCLVVGSGSYVGGLVGQSYTRDYYSRYISKADNTLAYSIVKNTKVYGNEAVGGALGGNVSYNSLQSAIIVENCDVRGNQTVGGLVGTWYYGQFRDCVVKDTYVCPLNDAAIAEISTISTLKINTTADYIRNFGAAYGYGGSGLYEFLSINCYIGGDTADYVGAIGGKNYKTYNNNRTYQVQSKGCVVVGRNYVGGIYGSLYTNTYETNNYNRTENVSSDALVYGKKDVAGIAGKVYDVLYTSNEGSYYTHAPIVKYTFFTGTLNSETNAALFFCDPQLDHMDFTHLSSMPYYVKCQKFDGIIEDNGREGRNYNFDDIVESTYDKHFSIWSQTSVIVNTVPSSLSNYITMHYSNYVLDAEHPDGFISVFADETQINEQFYANALNGVNTFKDIADDDYLPLQMGLDTSWKNPMYMDYTTYVDNTKIMAGGTRLEIHGLKSGLYLPDISTYYSNYLTDIRAREQIYLDGGAATIGTYGTIGYVAPLPDTNEKGLGRSDETISAYAIAADKVNLDLGAALADKCDGNATITITVGTTVLMNESSIDRRTYTLTYDFANPIAVTVAYTEDGVVKTAENTFAASDLIRKSMVGTSDSYYIGSDGKLYNANDNANAISDKTFVHVYNGEALDESGNCYTINDNKAALNRIVQCAVESYSEPLYRFTYNDRIIYTFDKYSYIYCNGTATATNDYRIFVKNGKLLVVDQNNNAIADGVYAYYEGNDSYIAVLKKDGKVLTLGTVDLTQRLSGFKNESIASMSSNMNVSTTTIIFTYKNGQSVGYDVVTGKELFKTTVTEQVGILQFVKSTLTTMFSVTASPITTQAQQSNGLTDLMNESDLSLDQVIELATINNGDAELTVKQIENGSVDASMLTQKSDDEEQIIVSEDIVAPMIEEIADKVGEENQLPKGYESTLKDEYIPVYNVETEQFDIYNAKEIMTKSDESVSETSRIVDQATLKSLYVTFANEDTTTSTGAKLYVGVAATIVVLLVAFFSLRKKEDKQ